MDKNNIQKLVTQALDSMEGAQKASPAPYLLTRINARMKNAGSPAGFWEKALLAITRPSIAFPALAIIVALNFWLITKSNSETGALANEYKLVTNDDYSLSTATSLFDFENLP
jgi:hypothetical protein